jgi:hypothetical protein
VCLCIYIFYLCTITPLISITPIVASNKLNLLYVMIDKKSKISQDAIDKFGIIKFIDVFVVTYVAKATGLDQNT